MSDVIPLDARLSDLDLAALLCSRVCHDIISPVGAIVKSVAVRVLDRGQVRAQQSVDL